MHLDSTEQTSFRRIQLLDEHLIDQIKAGEVIESTASMAKELIENAVDAGSNKITIKIKDDPLTYFYISDNGQGIHPSDLPLVFARHATSKIFKFDDLYNLDSYGFRGEAMASLGAVAKVHITSSSSGQSTHHLQHEYGKTINTSSITNTSPLVTGTEIIITDLFLGTPARLKFLQGKIAEIQKFKKILQAYVIAYPHIQWDWHFDDHFTKFESSSRHDQLTKIFKCTKLKEISLSYKDVSMSLFFPDEVSRKKNHKQQFIFVNKRPIQFSIAHSLISKAFSPQPCPAYCLWIETKSSHLDVNVHPSKTEVKFLDRSIILSLLSAILKKIIVLDPASSLQGNYSPATNQEYGKDLGNSIIATTSPLLFLKRTDNVIDQVINLNLLGEFLLQQVILNPDCEVESVPLLVSRPFEVGLISDKKNIQDLQKSGLAFDIINDHQILIKEIPKLWSFLDLELLMQHLLAKTPTQLFPWKNIIPIYSLPILLSQIKTQTLSDLGIVVAFNDFPLWQTKNSSH